MRLTGKLLYGLGGGGNILGRVRGDRVAAIQPAREINIGATARAKGACLGAGRPCANRTGHGQGSV